jgi:dipeptidyl aminopeptidase/acylaminoacyl peptidase
MRLTPLVCAATLAIAASSASGQTTAKRGLRSSDLFALRVVGDPQISPEGEWVAYTVTSIDSAKDKSDTDVWMTNWAGTQTIRLTYTPEGESSPRWSPDGRYLAFISARQDAKGGQVWILDRRGGEAQQLTKVKGGVSSIAWSPDSKRIALILDEQTDSIARKDTTEHKTPKPIVVDRYNFKRDIEGILGTSRTHLAIIDFASKKIDTLTHGLDDDDTPSWSPDGQRIAFVRQTIPEPGHVRDEDIYVIDAKTGATPKQLTDFDGPDNSRPSWSPDGKMIAFTRGDEPKFSAYHLNKLAVVASDGSSPARVVTAALDRPVSSPKFSADGKSVLAMIADDRSQQLVRIRVADGSVERLIDGKRVVQGFTTPFATSSSVAAPTIVDRLAIALTTPDRAAEVFAVDAAGSQGVRQLSHQNDSLFAQLNLATVEGMTSKSKDGTEVHSLLYRPAGMTAATRLPTILFIHGGPNGQDAFGFDFERQYFAAHGYAVLGVNYRGSNGRGSTYQKAIYADWGDKEVEDLLGAVDQAVSMGVADPDRLGIGGWSYGGILTDYTIASTPRFKAAESGAGSALQLSMYGTDEYITQYDLEIGPPWKAQDAWIKISYPFFHADRIKTPTLFMGGASDFNVPIIGGEQMYQALRSLGVETQLVIYPSQFHGLTIPSYRKDRLDRWLAWYDKHLKPGTTTTSEDKR